MILFSMILWFPPHSRSTPKSHLTEEIPDMETSRWRSLGRWLFALVVVPALIGGPVAFAFHQQNKMRNFRVVEPGVLYRSGQISLSALKRLVHDYGIKTVVTLRDAY